MKWDRLGEQAASPAGRIEGIATDRPSRPRTEAEPAAVIDLSGVGSTIWLHRGTIGVIVALCGALALVACLLMPLRYDATAKVLLDPRDLQVLQNEVNPSSGNGDETELFVQSQVQVVRSTDVLSSVVQSLDLVHDPYFGHPKPGFIAKLVAILGGAHSEAPDEAATSQAMRKLDRAITVRRPDKTFIFEIGVTTDNADQSALVANTVAKAFLAEITKVRSENIQRSAAALEARLDQLRAQLRDREQAVERYRASHGLVDSNGQLVAQQQLTDLNNQLAISQGRLAEQDARLKQVQRLHVAGDEADPATDAQFTAIAGLRATYASAKRARDQAATIYGRNYPTVVGLDLAVTSARQQLEAALDRLKQTARMGYEQAHASEESLQQRIAELKRAVGNLNENGVGLRELEREASASRTLYETFLNRARDLQERQSLVVINAKVITQAYSPLTRSGPSRMLILGGGLIAGLLLGIAFALARGVPAARPKRAPFVAAV